MRIVLLLIISSWYAIVANGQDFEVTKYNLGADLDFPSSIVFADEGDDKLWLKYNTTEGGSFVNKLLIFQDQEWSKMQFDVCTSCIRDFKTGPDGSLWIAATDEGVFKREGESWTKVLDIEARGLIWKENGEMVIINSEGAFTYDGENITEGSNANVPEILNINDLTIDLLGDIYMVLPSKLFIYNDTNGWVQKTELTTPMNVDVDSENRVWVTDNGGEIGYYQEGDYQGLQYFYFGVDGFVIDDNDVLWYSTDELVRNEEGGEEIIKAEDLIDDAIFINSIYADQTNKIWVASNFKSGVASVEFLGMASSSINLKSTKNATLRPNPALYMTTASFYLKTSAEVKIRIYNVAGKLIQSQDQWEAQGNVEIQIPTSGLRAGVYLVNISYNKETRTLKLVKQ